MISHSNTRHLALRGIDMSNKFNTIQDVFEAYCKLTKTFKDRKFVVRQSYQDDHYYIVVADIRNGLGSRFIKVPDSLINEYVGVSNA